MTPRRNNNHQGALTRLAAVSLRVLLLGSLLTGCSIGNRVNSDEPNRAKDPQLALLSAGTLESRTTQAPAHSPTAIPMLTPSPTVTPTPTPSPSPTPTQDPWVATQLASMSLEMKIGQMLMMGVSGTGMTPETCVLLQEIRPGAVIYTGANTLDPPQVKQFSQDLQNCLLAVSNVPLFIAVDHEGQYITRFQQGVTIFPPAQALGATGDPELAYQVAKAAGQELAYTGINMVLGPVADVLTNLDNTVIAERSFGGDPQAVEKMVAATVHGYQDAGLVATLKHFPGHGGVAEDSHTQLPVDSSDRTVIASINLPPFEGGIAAGAQAVMFSHIAFPALDPNPQPASLSAPVVDLLRQELHFGGMAIADSIQMQAITGSGLSIPEASLRAAQAGIDMIMVTNPSLAEAVRDRLFQAVAQGELTPEQIDQAAQRILTVKASSGLSTFQYRDAPTPDWQADHTLADQAGYRSVALLKNGQQLVPIPASFHRIVILAPVDVWGMDWTLTRTLTEAGFEPRLLHYPGPWNGAIQDPSALQSFPEETRQADLTLFLSWEAHLNRLQFGDDWQPQVIQKLIATGKPIIWVGLKSPTDLLEAPDAATYLATFGTTPGQLRALADILVGKLTPAAKNPFPGLE